MARICRDHNCAPLARAGGCLVFIVPALAFSQVLSFQHYTLRERLPSDHITAIQQDTRGYLWIGTDIGLSRFDGTEFKNITTADGLSNLYITDIIESRRHPEPPGTDGGRLRPPGTI